MPLRDRAHALAHTRGMDWPDRCTVHMLRHSYAVWSLSAGVPLEQVQDQTGHASIIMTKDKYGGFLPNSRQESAEVLGKALSGIVGIRRAARRGVA